MEQKYPQLEKGSKKYLCPACGKKTFVLYRLANGDSIDETVGRCDREIKCRYHKKPKEWFSKGNSITERLSTHNNHQSLRKQDTQESIDYIPLDYILKLCKTRYSNLVYFLFELFDWETIKTTIDPYFIGCTDHRKTVFPQIDEKGKCRSAKIMQYNRDTGKRTKYGINWVHSKLKEQGTIPKKFNFKTCIFGLHLIRSEKNRGKTICICESEKSAIIASGFMPEYLWMASGALGWLNVDKLKPLKGRKIILFPDSSTDGIAFNMWSAIAKEAKALGIEVSVSDLFENDCTDLQKEQGYDIADYLIDSYKEKLTLESSLLDQMIKINPALNTLIENLGLVEYSSSL